MIVVSVVLACVPISLDISSLSSALQVAYDLKYESWLDDDINNVNDVIIVFCWSYCIVI